MQGLTRDRATPHAFPHWYESPGATARFPKAVPARSSRLLTRCLSHLRLRDREVPNTGSSRDHGNTPLPESSRSECSKPLLPAEASTPARPYGAGTRQRHRPSPCSRRGSVTLSVPASRSPAQALPAGQVFPSNSHIPPSPSEQLQGEAATQLSQDSADPCETEGKGKSVALSWFSPRLLCFLAPQRSVRAWKVIF